MAGRRPAVKVIGGVLALLGALVCIVGFFPATMMAWTVWQDGGPDFMMMGSWSFTVTQFLLVCGVVFAVGAAFLGVGIQLFFRQPRSD